MGGKSSSPSKTTTETKMNPWEPAQGQLKDILGKAQQLYEKNGGLDAEAVQREIPSLTPEMASSLAALASSGQLTNVAQNLDKYTGDAGNYLSQAGQMAGDFSKQDFSVTGQQINDLSSQLYDNETVRSQKEQLAQDLSEQYNQSVGGLNQQATATGNMGSSRAGVAQGVMFGKQQQSLEKGESDIMNSARGQAQTAAVATLQQNAANRLNQYSQGMQTLGNLGTNLSGQYLQAQTTAGQLYQQQLQNQYTAAQQNQGLQASQQEVAYQNQVAQKTAASNNLNEYLNTVGKIGGLGGANSGSQTAPSEGGASGAQGALGGAMAGASAGAMIGGPWGAAVGGVVGGVAGAFSDATLKKDIKLKGKTKSGDAVYDWKWNEKGKEKGMKGSASGVLAQNLMKDKPQAMGKRKGALTVDYDQTSVKPKQKKK